jgi:hypothetical protein
MQYIVVPYTLYTPDIVLPLVSSRSTIQHLAKRHKNARFLVIFRQSGTGKTTASPRSGSKLNYPQISQMGANQHSARLSAPIRVICGSRITWTWK